MAEKLFLLKNPLHTHDMVCTIGCPQQKEVIYHKIQLQNQKMIVSQPCPRNMTTFKHERYFISFLDTA